MIKYVETFYKKMDQLLVVQGTTPQKTNNITTSVLKNIGFLKN